MGIFEFHDFKKHATSNLLAPGITRFDFGEITHVKVGFIALHKNTDLRNIWWEICYEI